MFLKIKQGDILTKPVELDNSKFLVGYAKEGGSPLLAIMDHGGVLSFATADDSDFEEILRLAGI